MLVKIHPPLKIFLVVCADGYACVKPGYVHSRWENFGRNPYDHWTEALLVARALDSFGPVPSGRVWPPAACGPHRVIAFLPKKCVSRSRQELRRRAVR
jgi:hypothetical protein